MILVGLVLYHEHWLAQKPLCFSTWYQHRSSSCLQFGIGIMDVVKCLHIIEGVKHIQYMPQLLWCICCQLVVLVEQQLNEIKYTVNKTNGDAGAQKFHWAGGHGRITYSCCWHYEGFCSWDESSVWCFCLLVDDVCFCYLKRVIGRLAPGMCQ